MGTNLREITASEVRAEMARQRRTGVELASHLHLSQQSTSRRLNGDQDFSLDELAAVADWLGIEVTALLSGKAVSA